MRITELTLSNFKGHTRSFALTPVTGVIGENFKGKTAMLEAITIALLGRHPTVGASGEKLATFGTDQGWSIEARFDTRATNIVELTRKGGKNSLKEARGVDVPPVLLDVQKEFFGLTSQQRISMIVAKGLGTSVGRAEILAEMEALEILPTAVTGPMIQSTVNVAAQVAQSEPVSKWLEQLQSSFLQTKKQAVADRKTAAATLSALKTNGGTIPQDQTKELAAADAAYQAANRDYAVLKEKVAAKERFLAAQFKNQDTAQQIKKLEGDREAWANTLAALIKEKGVPNVMALEKETADLTHALRVNEAKVSDLKHVVLAEAHELEELRSKLGKLDNVGACPFCLNHEEGWREASQDEYYSQITLAEGTMKVAKANLEQAQAKHIIDKANTEAAVNRLTEAKRIIAQQRGYSDNAKAIDQRLADLNRLASASAAAAPEAPTGIETAAAEAKVTETSNAVTALRQKQDAWNGHQNAKAGRQAAEAKVLEFTHQEAVLEALLEIVTRHLKQISGDVFKKLLEVANDFTTGILESPLEFHEGDIGRWRDGVWCSHTTFSGTEILLAYAGLSVALAQQSPFKVLLLDELGVVAPELKPTVIERLLKLVRSGIIDQCIWCDVTEPALDETEEFSLIRL